MADQMTSRERVLNLLNGKPVDRIPCFSGLGNVTVKGLEDHGIKFSKVHDDPVGLANAAASSYKLYGYECAVVPFDLCLEAEVLGCTMNPYDHLQDLLYPTIKEKSYPKLEDIKVPDKLETLGRVPVLLEAGRKLQEDIGKDVAIGTYLLGPFTLAGQCLDLEPLIKSSIKKPNELIAYLDKMADIQIAFAKVLLQDGPFDFLTIREMGATCDILSPRIFKKVIMGPLKKIFDNIPKPNILHICGGTTPILEMMMECGPGAISIDSKTSMKEAREKLGPDAVILGNFNAFNLLINAGADETKTTIQQLITEGASGIHPGCDIWPTAKEENMMALVEACKSSGNGS